MTFVSLVRRVKVLSISGQGRRSGHCSVFGAATCCSAWRGRVAYGWTTGQRIGHLVRSTYQEGEALRCCIAAMALFLAPWPAPELPPSERTRAARHQPHPA